MSILFSGDFHSNSRGEINLIYKDILIKKYGRERYKSIKYHIILGDGGFMWPHNKERDKRNYAILAKRKFPILCVIGNHEPIYGMKNIPEVDIGIGETVLQINDKPFTAYLKRGKVYTIDGIKFLVLGGALSVDKYRRVPDETWWELEYWTDREKQDMFKLLETENTFDCVISHTGPNRVSKKLFEYYFLTSSGNFYDKFFDKVAILNDKIREKIQFHEWLCGHFHKDDFYFDKRKKRGFQYLYRKTRIIEKAEGKLSVYNGSGEAERQY